MANELKHLAGQHLDCNNNDDGNSYMFSIGMITSYLLVEDEPLFYALRDNFVTYTNGPPTTFVVEFRQMPVTYLLRQMICINQTITIGECKERWSRILSVIVYRRTRLKWLPFKSWPCRHTLSQLDIWNYNLKVLTNEWLLKPIWWSRTGQRLKRVDSTGSTGSLASPLHCIGQCWWKQVFFN